MEYSEELLTQWHKWYSDSEDSDYDDEEDGDSLGVDRYVSDFSSSTSEDASSDEDYCGYYKPVKGSERRGRGRRRGANKDSTYQPTRPISPMSHSPSPVAHTPPPLISSSEVPPAPEVKIQKLPTVTPPIKIISPVKPAVPELVPIKSIKCQGSPVKPIVIGSSGHTTSSGLVQYYQVSGVQSLVPVQLVQSSAYSASPGSVIMLQPARSGGPQRVSVIMNPRPSQSSSNSYITQLDGSLPWPHPPTAPLQLEDEFESMRKKAKQTLLLDSVYQQEHPTASTIYPTSRGAKRKAKTQVAPKDSSSQPSSSLSMGPPSKKNRKDVPSSNGGGGGGEGESSGYQCKECGVTFPDITDLRLHAKIVHTPPVGSLCKILPKKSTSEGHGSHDGTVTGPAGATKAHNQLAQTGRGRGKARRNPTKYASQKKTKSTRFSCPTCREPFDNVPNLSAHVFAVHAKLDVSEYMYRYCI